MKINSKDKEDYKTGEWITSVYDFICSNGIKIPVLKGLFKGSGKSEVRFTIPENTAVRIQIIKESDSGMFKYVAEVQRAAINIGVAILERMFVNNGGKKYKYPGTYNGIHALDEESMMKMQLLDAITASMARAIECKNKGILSGVEFENRISGILNDIRDNRVRELAVEKYKRLSSGDKITSLFELDYGSGGNRRSE